MTRIAPACLLVLVLLVASGCVDDGAAPPGAEPSPCAPTAQVVDEALLAFLSKAKSSHQLADLAESDGDRERAIAVLEGLVRGTRPGGDEELAPEAREVLADSHARLAELRSAAGDYAGAKKDIDRGLALAAEPTHYRGRLMEVLGTVEQRQYERLLEEGDDAGARAAKERAIAALEAAVAIQDDVIKRLLGE